MEQQLWHYLERWRKLIQPVEITHKYAAICSSNLLLLFVFFLLKQNVLRYFLLADPISCSALFSFTVDTLQREENCIRFLNTKFRLGCKMRCYKLNRQYNLKETKYSGIVNVIDTRGIFPSFRYSVVRIVYVVCELW